MIADSNNKEMTIETLQQELDNMFNGNKEDLEEWLDFSLSVLGGERPRKMFDTSERRQRLYNVILEMRFGETA